MKRIQKGILITLGIGVVLIVMFYFITGAITKYTGFFVSDDVLNDESDFEVCLGEQDITLYINTNNPVGSLREVELVDYLEYFKIVNCVEDNRGCLDAGISDFSGTYVWVVNGEIIKRDVGLPEMSRVSKCRLS